MAAASRENLNITPGMPPASRRQGRRVRGVDAGFLYVESAVQTSACVDVVLLAAPEHGSPALTRDALLERLAARADRVPHLHRRLHHVPGGLGHAVWADDHRFVLDDHVHHATMPAPSGEAEFLDVRAAGDRMLDEWLAAEVTASHLPLDRPLWDVTLLDGFPDGRQALVHRFHHTLGDGTATIAMLTELLDDRAIEVPSPALPADHARQRPPNGIVLLVVALLRLVVLLTTIPALVLRTSRRAKAVKARRARAEHRVPGMAGDAPRTVLDISRDTERRLGRAHLHLDDVRKVRDAVGVSLSDVVVSLVAGALRDHLAERDALPEAPLVVNVPLGNDPVGARPRLRGNCFVNYYALLPTHLDDPRDRLRSTADHAREAKLQLELQGRTLIPTWLDRIPPRLAAAAARGMGEKAASGENPPDFNVLVSNLKVPRSGWTLDGRTIESVFLLGPLTSGNGINITVTGYGDVLTCGVHTNPAAVPDPSSIARAMEAELANLLAVHGLSCTTCAKVA
ncbi:wax ester/triacylglycerol synthase domain-containing protein [Nocardioides yefusunii]|uniref:diacylglycerol O-acyltransferase n=1 Tax=Nocardioides yefusunii TaxID=2500546 RepID=A0ABW1R3T1_9ACTN|nr:wax ester/triacylglycerol synthase domain-containing protein [Nocardioides yefusunii]